VFFANEEPPYFMGEGMGSWRHARALHDAGQKVSMALILESIGYYSSQENSQRYPAGLEKRFPSTGNFIGFVGASDAEALVKRTLAEFKAASSFPAQGLAAPAGTAGVMLSDHASYARFGAPALMITDTAFMRSPYYHTSEDTPDKLDYASMARVVAGLSKVIIALASKGAA
jgi:Zn-dependent M28 family amino/carboxypeptidase